MAQLERSTRSSEYSRSPHANQASEVSQRFGNQLQENASNGWVSKSSSPIYDRSYDHNKKSVFMKVKEKAKQLRHSLSGKKKHGMGIHDDDNTTPSHSHSPSNHVKFEDAEDHVEHPEYLGAPMYESEQAPERVKQNSDEHQPENQPVEAVIPGNLALPNNMDTEVKLPSKTLTESVSDATHNIASKIATGLTITNSDPQETDVAASADAGSGNVDRPKTLERNPEFREHSDNSTQNYDKGVSVKEYFVRKLEPGEDEKALSRAISDTLSPRNSPRQKGVVDKFRDAVSSLLWNAERSEKANTNDYKALENPAYNPENPSPDVPVPNNISEEIEEKSHGRALQSN